MSEEIFQIAKYTIQKLAENYLLNKREKIVTKLFEKTLNAKPQKIFSKKQVIYAQLTITENIPQEIKQKAEMLGKFFTDEDVKLQKIIVTAYEAGSSEREWTDYETFQYFDYDTNERVTQITIYHQFPIEKIKDEKLNFLGTHSIFGKIELYLEGRRYESDC